MLPSVPTYKPVKQLNLEAKAISNLINLQPAESAAQVLPHRPDLAGARQLQPSPQEMEVLVPPGGAAPAAGSLLLVTPLLPLSSTGVANWETPPHPLLGQVFGSQLRCTGAASCTSQGRADTHFFAKIKK